MNQSLIISCLVFTLGMYYYINYVDSYLENFETQDCPNLLIQKGSKLYLKYTTKAEIPGVNPVEFNNLEEYVEYIEWQRHKKISCPVLFLKREYDAQNNEVYKAQPGVGAMLSGIQSRPANISTEVRSTMNPNKTGQDPYSELLTDTSNENPRYNQNMYAGRDSSNQQGSEATQSLDNLYNVQEMSLGSFGPMDSTGVGTGVHAETDSGKKVEQTEPIPAA